MTTIEYVAQGGSRLQERGELGNRVERGSIRVVLVPILLRFGGTPLKRTGHCFPYESQQDETSSLISNLVWFTFDWQMTH